MEKVDYLCRMFAGECHICQGVHSFDFCRVKIFCIKILFLFSGEESVAQLLWLFPTCSP
jgi:hypothetical protein